MKDLCQVGHRMGDLVVKALARTAKILGSNVDLDTFQSVGEKIGHI